MRIVLVLSLALNLAVIGVAAGSALRFGGVGAMHPPARGMVGALLHEMPRSDRRQMRDLARSRSDRADPRRDEMAAMAAALRAVPFDPAAVTELIGRHVERRAMFQTEMLAGWLDRVAAMSDSERAAYVDRLESTSGHRHRRRHD
jgi:uncharacterized membrane protein